MGIRFMPLSKSFFVKIGKIINDRDKLIYQLDKINERNSLLKNSLSKSSNKLSNGGLKTQDKVTFTRDTKNKIAELKLERQYIISCISVINKKIKYQNKSSQKYSSKLSQIFIVIAGRNLPENEFEKIKKQANKVLENRRNNIQTWE